MQIKFQNYRGLIFDLDGTLINSMPSHVQAWKQCCAERGFSIDEKIIYDLGGVSSKDVALYLKKLGYDVGDIDTFIKRKYDLYRENIHLVKSFDKVVQIVKNAVQLNIKIAIGSGTQRQNAIDGLKNNNLLQYVNVIISGDDVVNHKPYPDTFIACAKAMDLEPKDCLVFEDGKPGIQAAINGGFDYVIVDNGNFVSDIIKTKH